MGDKSLYYLTSVQGTHFTGALAQNAVESESIELHSDLVALGCNEIMIESVTVQSYQNLDWDVGLWGTADFGSTTFDNDNFIDYFNFANASGKTFGAANHYYYANPANDVSIPYIDLDRDSKLHITLANRHATGKAAGATGLVVVKIGYRPVWGV